ncbi:MAG: hypothetical protein VB081_08765 [Christensenella sp.]|uniref:hypothetical protein n=1 Tax=Christensenella sp. TaxID=1935934 RepID=UPI002B201F60|nr:hypothetical protein [Christensenella sp.]MEA5003576.1 hypothetical protein [Christensenella sp.]
MENDSRKQKKVRGNVIFVVVITVLIVLFVLSMVKMFNTRVAEYKLSPEYQAFQERWAEQHDPAQPTSLFE